MLSEDDFLTELTPAIMASICGGVDTRPTKNEPDKSRTKIRIGKGRARISYYLAENIPDKNLSNDYGECQAYFDDLTGQFTFACALRDSGISGDKLFPDL